MLKDVIFYNINRIKKVYLLRGLLKKCYNQVQCTHLRRRRRIRIQIRMGGYRLFLLLPFRAAAFYRFNNKRGAESLDSANRQSHNHDVLCLMANGGGDGRGELILLTYLAVLINICSMYIVQCMYMSTHVHRARTGASL